MQELSCPQCGYTEEYMPSSNSLSLAMRTSQMCHECNTPLFYKCRHCMAFKEPYKLANRCGGCGHSIKS